VKKSHSKHTQLCTKLITREVGHFSKKHSQQVLQSLIFTLIEQELSLD